MTTRRVFASECVPLWPVSSRSSKASTRGSVRGSGRPLFGPARTLTPSARVREFQYLHMDHQGSVQKVTDDSQNIISTYTNDAFGRQIVAPTHAHPWLGQDFQFQSNWMTFVIGGQTYCLSPSRVYNPDLGRWLQSDLLPNLTNTIWLAAGNGCGIYGGRRHIKRAVEQEIRGQSHR